MGGKRGRWSCLHFILGRKHSNIWRAALMSDAMENVKAMIRKWAEENAEDLDAIIKVINSAPEVTQNRYDQYMTTLLNYREMTGANNNQVMIFALALVERGADKKGISSALRIIGVS
jgi:hypothetical protein